jgi:hypothetical protein
MGFDDLSWIKNSNEEKQGRYICVKCVPMTRMIEVTDPKLTEFLGPGRHRYQCPKCNDIYDSTEPIARVEEMITTLPGDTSDSNNNTSKNNHVVFEPIHNEHRDDVHGTKLGREHFEQIKPPAQTKTKSFDPDDNEDIKGMGVNITRTEVKSSVTGKTYVEEYK